MRYIFVWLQVFTSYTLTTLISILSSSCLLSLHCIAAVLPNSCSLRLPIDTELLREPYPLFRRLFLNNFLALFSPPLLSLLFYQLCFCGFLHPRKGSHSYQLLYLIHDSKYHAYERQMARGEKPERRSIRENVDLLKPFVFLAVSSNFHHSSSPSSHLLFRCALWP